ncbi:MAG: COX15/CtaA family protein [Acidimicrobiia bacterium]
MTALRRLAIVTTAATYLLVVAGGTVRATGSGLGCPDWPRCHGSLVPPLEYHALIEYSHRLIASVVIILTLVLAGVALAGRRRIEARARRLALATVPVVFSQALLGALVVALELHAESVVAHLLVAMSLFAILISLVVETSPSVPAPGDAPADRRFARRLTGVMVSVLALMLLGSYVSGRDAGLAFPDWPLFDGRLIPATHGVLPDLHFAHRVLAAAVSVAVFALARSVRRRPQAGPVNLLVRIASAVIGIEILVGAGNVWTHLSPATRSAHLALGALIFAALFAASRLAWRLPSPAGATPGAALDPESGRAPVGSPA